MKFSIKNNIFFQKCILWALSFLLALFIGKSAVQGKIEYIIFLFLLFFIFFILAKPLIGLIISIPLILYFSYIDILWVSPWNYFIFFLATIVILALFLKGKIKINKYSQRIWIVSILFLVWVTIINLIQGIELPIILTNNLKLISVFLLGFCTMFFIKNEKQLKLFSYSLIFFMSISAFVGIMQFFGIDFFWKLREFFGINPNHIVGQQILQRDRVPGLAYFSIPFGYQLASIVPFVFGILLVKKKSFLKNISLKIALGICLLGLLASLSKSAIIGGIIGLFAVMFLTLEPKKRKKKIIFSIMILIFIILILNSFTNNLILGNFSNSTDSALSRIPLFLTAFKIFLSNPFGIGTGQFNQYGAEFFSELSHLPGAYHILTTSSHNQFLNTLVYYGIFGLLLLLAFYYYIFKGLFRIYKYFNGSFIKGITIGLIGSFIAYIINSMFHNAGPFLIDPFNWYFIGITMFLFNYCGKYLKSYEQHKFIKN